MNTFGKRFLEENQIRDCYIKIDKLKKETVILAKYAIRDCCVLIDRDEFNEAMKSMKIHK